MGASGAGNGGEAESRLELETDDPRRSIEQGGPQPVERRQIPAFVIVSAALAVLLSGATIVGYFWYNGPTKVDRADPHAVLHRYLTVRFNDPVPDKVRLYVCERADLKDLEGVLDTLAERKRSNGVAITIEVADFSVEIRDDSALAATRLEITYASGTQMAREYQQWSFGFVDPGNWRVCSARRL